jgi:hypothetical protein
MRKNAQRAIHARRERECYGDTRIRCILRVIGNEAHARSVRDLLVPGGPALCRARRSPAVRSRRETVI